METMAAAAAVQEVNGEAFCTVFWGGGGRGERVGGGEEE